MGAAWAAGSTRARAMAAGRLGAGGAREIAAAGTLDDAVRRLAAAPYRHEPIPDASPAGAQRAVSAALLWRLRVLAGWLPRTGAGALRLFAAGFEISNTEDHLRTLSGPRTASLFPPYRLGSLATVWPRLARTGSPPELRAVLAASVWGDPGDGTPAAVGTGMRISAARRVAAQVPEAVRWAAGRLALLVAREEYVCGRRLTEPSARRAAQVLGAAAVRGAAFAVFRRHLPATARWALDGIEDPADLWRAEARWWGRLERDGLRLLRDSSISGAPVVGGAAVLCADAWRVRAALEMAARGGGPLEAFDALV